MVPEKINRTSIGSIQEAEVENHILSCPDCYSSNYNKQGVDNKKGQQTYGCRNCGRRFTATSKPKPKAEAPATSPELEFEKDIWDIRVFGVELAPGRSYSKLNFTRITQYWLLRAAKKFIRYTLTTCSHGNAISKLYAMIHFSDFLANNYPSIQPKDINRSVVIEFLSYLTSLKLSNGRRLNYICDIKGFFEQCVLNDWLKITHIPLIREGDFPKTRKNVPKFIPQEIVDQLNQHLDALPQPVTRMVLVVQEAGMRVSELLKLKFDCINQDTKGGWWLTYYQHKMKKDHSIPIRPEIAAIIQEQQQYIRENLGFDFPYLFCGNKHRGGSGFFPEAKTMLYVSFRGYLVRLAEEKNIRDLSGCIYPIWNFHR